MLESEFRDWARRQFSMIDERLRAVAAVRAEPVREEIAESLMGTFAGMAEELSIAVRGGGVRGLGIVLVSDGGRTKLGFAASDGGYFRLAGAVQLLGHSIIDDRMKFQQRAEGAEGAC